MSEIVSAHMEDAPQDKSPITNVFGDGEERRAWDRLPGRIAVRGKKVLMVTHADKFSPPTVQGVVMTGWARQLWMSEPWGIEWRPFRKGGEARWRPYILQRSGNDEVARRSDIGFVAGRDWPDSTTDTGGQTLYRFLVGFCPCCRNYGSYPDLTQQVWPDGTTKTDHAALQELLKPALDAEGRPL